MRSASWLATSLVMSPPAHRRALRPAVLGATVAAALAVAPARRAAAQTPPAVPEPAAPDTTAPARTAVAECFGFAFGPWRPALDWRAAGHGADSPPARSPGEFAARDSAGGESELLLFPSWWPAGVGVRFARPPRVAGDTVAGVAHAFVADGRRPTPSAAVRAWLKPCGGGTRPQ